MSGSAGYATGEGKGEGKGEGFGKGEGKGDGKGEGKGEGKGDGKGDSGSQVTEGQAPGAPGGGAGTAWGVALTGGGMPSGTGFLGGYGAIARSAYATPLSLGAKPWALDFTYQGGGWPPFPVAQAWLDPDTRPQWTTDDWDPGLRYWDLPYDPQLTEWLQDVDLAQPSVMAAREFGARPQLWQKTPAELVQSGWMRKEDLAWHVEPGAPAPTDPLAATAAIQRDLDELVELMKDDRGAFISEALAQSEGIPAYFMHLMAMEPSAKPWTLALMRCGLAMGNLVYMHYKAQFRRVRPSMLCPGLVPPFGPPRHPAFPSGHSFLAHFMALLLLEIPGVARRFGVYAPVGQIGVDAQVGRQVTLAEYQAKTYRDGMPSPLLWLAHRLARNRERVGVHYPSDSSASRDLAGGIWDLVKTRQIAVPTLHKVIARARAEWDNGA